MKNHFFSFLVICLGFGIFLSDSINPGPKLRIYFILLFFTLFFSQLIHVNILRNMAFFLQVLLLGLLIHQGYNRVIDPNSYIDNSQKIYHIKIESVYKSSTKYLKFKTKNLKTGASHMLYLDTIYQAIYPADTLIVIGKNYSLSPPLNPNQFDYSKYLQRQQIRSNLYVNAILAHYSNHQNWRKLTAISKEKLRENLKEKGFTKEARSIISSMLLGDRSEITDELNDNYVATGVVHILSISGLHVVMIYVILQFVLRPILYLKHGKNFRIIISLFIIWIFAFYVDLQPPVFRSALMITIYYLSELLKRPKNIYHTIALSAFIILIFQPNYLFDVGFQLSFSAVFFIVWLNPIYKKIYHSKSKIIQYLYDLTTTSFSAQLGTMPFATYYFNQFSGLFLLGNLVLIPASFIMIVGAILAIFLTILDINLPLYTTIYNEFIWICNAYIKWLSHHKSFIYTQLNVSLITAFTLLVIIYLIRPLILKRSKWALALFLISFICLQIECFISIKLINNTNEVVVFNQFKSSVIGIRNGQNLTVFYSETNDTIKMKKYLINPYQIKNRIIYTSYFPIDTCIDNSDFYKTKNILIVGNHRIYLGQNLDFIPAKIDYIVVRNSSFKPQNLENITQIKRVITDGSNYPNYVAELDSILNLESDSILWKTSEQGFYQLKF